MSDQVQASYIQGLALNDLLAERKFLDVVIQVQHMEFEAHKVILSNCSPYFRSLFSRWSSPRKRSFIITKVSPQCMQLILEFAYTGFILVTEQTVRELLIAADRFNIVGIIGACSAFLEERVCLERSVEIWRLTNMYYCSAPNLKAFHFILDHFEEIDLSSTEFLKLSLQDLVTIIESDRLNVRDERVPFEAILRWISYSPRKRKTAMAVLLSKVRLALMSNEYFVNNVQTNELVCTNNECRAIARRALHLQTQKISDLSDPLARPRLPNAILLATQGWSEGFPTNILEAYDIRTQCWVNVTNSEEHPRAYHGAAFINGSLYCIGGNDGETHLSTVCRFDLSTHTWHDVASMYSFRCYVSVTVLNGYIYAMGGHDGRSRLNTAERYDAQSNQWTLIAPMHAERSDASCTTFNGKVYICGGFNGNDCLFSAEYYDPETDQWTEIVDMGTRRSGLGVAAYTNRIYAVGGFNGDQRLNTAEAYDPETNTWLPVASMATTRSNFGIEVLEGRLFVVGGYDGTSITSEAECYDVRTGQWAAISRVELSRSALSCCVVSGLPNMAVILGRI